MELRASGSGDELTDSDDDGHGPKRSKETVNYRAATGKKRCRNCRYSYGPTGDRRCMKVKGQIKPDDVCDLWRGM